MLKKSTKFVAANKLTGIIVREFRTEKQAMRWIKGKVKIFHHRIPRSEWLNIYNVNGLHIEMRSGE